MNTQEARIRLEESIKARTARAGQVLSQVMGTIPEDKVVKAEVLGFAPVPENKAIVLRAGDQEFSLHRHALRQVAGVAKVPVDFVDRLTEGESWQGQLLADVLTRIYSHASDHGQKKHLIRVVGGQVRGFLSDSYRRLDSRPIFDAFLQAAQQAGAQPYGGHASDIRAGLKLILPGIHAIQLGDDRVDLVAFGAEISTSDFGAGLLAIRSFIERLVCLNGATAEDLMKQVHLGKRLTEDVEFSQKTYELDTRATVSAVRDITRAAFGEAKIAQLTGRIQKAQSQEVKWENLKARLGRALTKDELRKAGEAFEGPDVQNLPPGNNLWRASNAVSWILKGAESEDRKVELEKLAGSLLENKVVFEAEYEAA